MAKTALDLSEEELKKYNPRANLEKIHDERLKEKAWTVASKAEKILKEEFGVDKVFVFGSLARDDQPFTRWSDVDLAVKGLSEDQFFRASARMDYVDDRMPVEIFSLNSSEESLKKKIEQEGIEL